LLPIAITHIRDRRRFILFGGPRELSIEQRRNRARRLADAFERLGTTYIKLAQFMTTRPDFIPPIYVEAMERLQDEVPPEDFGGVRALLEEEFDAPIEEVFGEFNEEAISGASIAQVHRATVEDESVVVKIRRPGLEKLIEADLNALSLIIPIALYSLRFLGQESHAESAEGITKELQKTLREEINFRREASVMEEIRQNFERDGVDRVVVPTVYRDYSTKKVLTMSYEPGVKVKYVDELKRRGHDPEEIVDSIAEAYLYMAFTYDVFQADPHQGNLAVNDEGKVVIYDYGIAQRPDPETRDAFKRMFVGVALHNPDRVVDALHEMGAVDPSMDRETLVEVSQIMIMDIAGHEIEEREIEQIERKVDETLYDYPLKFPQEIVLAMRATFGIEGLCARMAPEYDFTVKLHEFFIEQGEIDLEEIEKDVVGDGFVPSLMKRLDSALGRSVLFGSERPVLNFVGRNPGILEIGPLNRLGLSLPATNGQTDISDFEFEETGEGIDGEEIKEKIEDMSKQSGKRTAWSVLGGASLISGAVTVTQGSSLWIPFFLLALFSFFMVKRSFADKGGVMGPKYVATRHEISNWDEVKEDEVESVNVDTEADGIDKAVGNGDGFDEFDDSNETGTVEKGVPEVPARPDGGVTVDGTGVVFGENEHGHRQHEQEPEFALPKPDWASETPQGKDRDDRKRSSRGEDEGVRIVFGVDTGDRVNSEDKDTDDESLI